MNIQLNESVKTRKTIIYPNLIFKWFAISLVVHLVLAWFSLGFYHFDEHFQILEFAGYKAGLIKTSSLTWEYAGQIRAAFQPYIAYCVIKLLQSLHRYDPFVAATMLRMMSAILGWASSLLVSLAGLRYIENAGMKKFFIILSAILAPLVFVHVRFSSEGWSGSLVFLGMAVTMLVIARKDERRKTGYFALFLLSGFLMGLAYLCRFQVAIVILAFMLWLLFMAKMSFKNLLWISMGILVAMLVGALLDRLFYGDWVNTSYRYFYVNIVIGIAAQFGKEPSWWYLKEISNNGFYYLQVPMMLLVVIAFITKIKNPFVWVSIAFIMVHFAISHKEFRFLFPLVDALPLLLVFGLGTLFSFFGPMGIIYKTGASIFVLLFVFINFISVLCSCLSPYCTFLYPMYYIYKNYQGPVDIVISDPYVHLLTNGVLRMNYYERPNEHFIYQNLNNIDSIKQISRGDTNPLLLMEWNKGFEPQKSWLTLYPYLLPEYTQFPSWLRQVDLNRWEERTSCWQVYRIK